MNQYHGLESVSMPFYTMGKGKSWWQKRKIALNHVTWLDQISWTRKCINAVLQKKRKKCVAQWIGKCINAFLQREWIKLMTKEKNCTEFIMNHVTWLDQISWTRKCINAVLQKKRKKLENFYTEACHHLTGSTQIPWTRKCINAVL